MQIKNLNKLATDYVNRLSDVRFAGQVVFVVIILLISWSGIKSIQTNYTLQKEISELNQKNTNQQLENNNLALQNEYYKSRQYLELSARQNFGLAAQGEKVIIVPKNVALKHVADLPEEKLSDIPQPKQTFLQRNINSWIDFFLHRQDAR